MASPTYCSCTTISARQLPARCHHRAPLASIIRQFQLHYHLYQFTSWTASIHCCQTMPLGQSSYACPSTWFVLGHLLPQIENVFNGSRHQRLLTDTLRHCAQIFLLTYIILPANAWILHEHGPPPSSRHLSNDDCLEDKMENYQQLWAVLC